MVPGRGIFVVADGMGGHAAGEVGSGMAVRFVARELGSLKGLAGDQVADRMRTAIRAANGAIFQRTLPEHEKRGMGTTVTALVLYSRARKSVVSDTVCATVVAVATSRQNVRVASAPRPRSRTSARAPCELSRR